MPDSGASGAPHHASARGPVHGQRGIASAVRADPRVPARGLFERGLGVPHAGTHRQHGSALGLPRGSRAPLHPSPSRLPSADCPGHAGAQRGTGFPGPANPPEGQARPHANPDPALPCRSCRRPRARRARLDGGRPARLLLRPPRGGSKPVQPARASEPL